MSVCAPSLPPAPRTNNRIDHLLFAEDGVAVNRAILFKIETFEPTDSFRPAKPYWTRLEWRDLADDEQSKLLVTSPETVIAEILDAKVEAPVEAKRRGGGCRGAEPARAEWKPLATSLAGE